MPVSSAIADWLLAAARRMHAPCSRCQLSDYWSPQLSFFTLQLYYRRRRRIEDAAMPCHGPGVATARDIFCRADLVLCQGCYHEQHAGKGHDACRSSPKLFFYKEERRDEAEASDSFSSRRHRHYAICRVHIIHATATRRDIKAKQQDMIRFFHFPHPSRGASIAELLSRRRYLLESAYPLLSFFVIIFIK